MMGSYSPEGDQAMKLLKLLSDPEKAAAKIAEFDTAKTLHDEALAALNKAKDEWLVLQDNLTGDHAKREEELAKGENALAAAEAELQRKVEAHDAMVEAQVKLLNSRNNEARDIAASQGARSAELAQRETDLTTRHQALAKAEADLKLRTIDANRLHAIGSALAKEHQAKLDQLRQLVLQPVEKDEMKQRAAVDAGSGS
jgi:hypothetical protein